jgi:hypothetical protein
MELKITNMFLGWAIWILAMGISELPRTIRMEFTTITLRGRTVRGILGFPTSSTATGERCPLEVAKEGITVVTEMRIAPAMERHGGRE